MPLLAAFFGTPETNRTSDLPLRRGLLYPLSYRGVDDILRQSITLHSRVSTLSTLRPNGGKLTYINPGSDSL